MLDKIKTALKAENIGLWYISEAVSRSAEVFFVRKNMDLKRTADLTDYNVEVFRELERDGEKLLGSSSVPVYTGQSEEEIRASLRKAAYAASFAANPRFELLSGTAEPHVPSASGFAPMGVEEMAKVMGDALFAPDTQSDVFVNSAEIFAVKRSSRVVNSCGVDVSWDTCEVRGEFVIQCPAPQDVETYHGFAYREPDTGALTELVRESLRQTRDRALAVQAPKAGRCTVLLTGEHVAELFGYYVSRSSTGAVYHHYSDFELGKDVQGGDVSGDRLTVELTAAEPYDREGIRLTDRVLMEEGVLRTFHGGVRFSRYLGLEPTGDYRSIRVPTGSTPLAELRALPCLEVVTFSDFQMDPMSGHFAGEIRLAYLHDGEKVTPVTGGSVNGNLLEAQKTMRMSRERYTSSTYTGPYAVALQDIPVAGE